MRRRTWLVIIGPAVVKHYGRGSEGNRYLLTAPHGVATLQIGTGDEVVTPDELQYLAVCWFRDEFAGQIRRRAPARLL